MVLDFAALPPEINSGLMYTGAGAGPLMAAAAAWSSLAAELSTTATSWESIIGTLTGSQWTGAGSAAAAAAAAPYISWLTTTAAAAEQAGALASASAGAYEAAFTGTVPPPVIAANRATLAALVATNFLGINTPAIMATEALYAEMWVQDAITMYTYAAASTAAAALQPLTPAAPTASPAAAGIQSTAVSAAFANAASAPAAGGLGSILSQVFAPGEAIGTGFWNAAQAAGLGPLLTSLDGFAGTPAFFNAVNGAVNTGAWFTMNAIPTTVSLAHTLAAAAPAATASDVVPLAGGAAIGEGTLVNSVGGGMSAGMAEASSVGGLSVPAGWSSAAPATLASSTAPLEGSGWTAAAEAEPVTAMPGMPGMAGAAKGAGAYGAGPRYGFKPIVMPKQVVV